MYDCSGYYTAPADSDSISIDSLGIDGIDEYIEYDEQGNPVKQPADEEGDNVSQEPTAEPANTEATKEE
jgi:penicillin-binding protein 1A